MAEKVLQKIGGVSTGAYKVVGDVDVAYVRRSMPVPATATGTATLTTAQILNGFLIGTPAAPAAYTLPLAATLDAAVEMDVGEAFVFHIRNDAVAAGATITVTASAGWTTSGSILVHSSATPAAGESAFGTFAARKTAASTFTLYRVGA